MAKTAFEEWKRLNQAINCRHYIGTRSHKVIDDALLSLESPAEVEDSLPATTLKGTARTASRRPINSSKSAPTIKDGDT